MGQEEKWRKRKINKGGRGNFTAYERGIGLGNILIRSSRSVGVLVRWGWSWEEEEEEVASNEMDWTVEAAELKSLIGLRDGAVD